MGSESTSKARSKVNLIPQGAYRLEIINDR